MQEPRRCNWPSKLNERESRMWTARNKQRLARIGAKHIVRQIAIVGPSKMHSH